MAATTGARIASVLLDITPQPTCRCGVSATTHGHLVRLPPEFYRGVAWVHWTFAIRDRGVGWLNKDFDIAFRQRFAACAEARNIGCLAACLMPDHIHLLLCGLSDASDQRLFVRALRRETGSLLSPLAWQKQAYDHVLRGEERSQGVLLAIAHYIIENPVRLGLVGEARGWPHRAA